MTKDKCKILEYDTTSEPNLLLVRCPYCSSTFSIPKRELRQILSKGEYIKGKR
jgi:hypothetical protein